jgi:hypothetical protein
VPVPLRADGASACGSHEPFLFLGVESGHARRTFCAARVFRPACDGVYLRGETASRVSA